MEFVIISGMSGAGKSRAAAILEDIGYYCVDNMPAELIPKFAEMCIATKGRYEHVVLVTDVRGGADFHALFEALDCLKSLDCQYRILYFEASTETLIRRYKETRRRHPLAVDGISTREVIEREHNMLEAIRARADYIIDTTNLSTAKLRERMLALCSDSSDPDKSINITVMSFGFKYGIPAESDLVFDVRFLPNPYYLTELRSMTGCDAPVRDYVLSWPQTHEFLRHLFGLCDFLIPQYVEEGKTSLVIAIGCTGGKHRSVALTEVLSEHIGADGYRVCAVHRDAGRE